jgi:DNA-binding GntR family transcriptional regulator
MSTAPYLAIADAIRGEIVRRKLAPHSRLPSEPELVKRHRAARATIRRALAKLREDGLIYSRQAVGSFVAEARVEQDLDQLFSFSEFMIYRGMAPGTRILSAGVRRVTPADLPLIEHLGLKPGSRVIFLRRLRLGSGQPLVIANTWLPAARFRGFLKHDLERRSVYEILESAGLKPTDAVETIEAVTLSGEEARLLTVPQHSPALLIRRVGYAQAVPVEYAVDYYRGDRTQFRVRLGVLEKRVSGAAGEDRFTG